VASIQLDRPDPAHVGTLSDLLPPGGLIAFGDGAGAPLELWPATAALLRSRPDVRLLLGWMFATPPGLAEFTAERIRTLVSGFGMRRPIDAGHVGFVPARLGTVPSLLSAALRPDVLIAALRPVSNGYAFTTEVSWQRAAVLAGARVAAVIRPDSPSADVQVPLGVDDVQVLLSSDGVPIPLPMAEPTDQQRTIAERVARHVTSGLRLQVGPGGLGAAVYDAISAPVHLDTGLITDPVLALHRRGLLLGAPVAPYLAGSMQLYDWAPGRTHLCGVEVSHDPGRLLAGPPLISVNTAIEIDLDGQVNAEVAGRSSAGGIGGQPDYAAAAASSSTGLSIFALPTCNGAQPTLVSQLSGPVTTPGHDVELVVTETGSADLRGLSRAQRRRALVALWGDQAP
jgi:acyl-CoA hydrolase